MTKQRKASASNSLSSLTSNDVSEMMLPPFLRDPRGEAKPELVMHSFRLERPSDQKTRYNLKIKWYERKATKLEFEHDINMSIKDIEEHHRNSSRSSSSTGKSPTSAEPEPQYISINGVNTAEKKGNKVVARAIAQLKRNGNTVRMLFRDEHSPNATLCDVVNTVISQLDADGTSPDVYILSQSPYLTRPATTLRYGSLPDWRLSDVVVDVSKELHVAVDFTGDLAKMKKTK